MKISESFSKLPSLFNSEAAKGMDVVYQYEVSGEGGGNWYVTIKNSTCVVKEGVYSSPNVTLKLDSTTFLSLLSGELNAMSAFMTGKLKVSGDILLAQRLPQLFTFK